MFNFYADIIDIDIMAIIDSLFCVEINKASPLGVLT